MGEGCSRKDRIFSGGKEHNANKLGLRITGKAYIIRVLNFFVFAVLSFVEFLQYIFTVPGVKFFLSNKLSQDPIEKFFGQQRQRGSSNDNSNTD